MGGGGEVALRREYIIVYIDLFAFVVYWKNINFSEDSTDMITWQQEVQCIILYK